MAEPLHEERRVEERKSYEEPAPDRTIYERRYMEGQERDNMVALAAIRYTAIVIIVISILYFLAVYLIPALTGR
ncbi:MAG: hypothetical protein K6T91_10935 [Firmicutes bacterium]|nr:hypothetical protein [Bacillota bacterium]